MATIFYALNDEVEIIVGQPRLRGALIGGH